MSLNNQQNPPRNNKNVPPLNIGISRNDVSSILSDDSVNKEGSRSPSMSSFHSIGGGDPNAYMRDQMRSLPLIRESSYGQTLGSRSSAQIESWSDNKNFPMGGPDLIHWGNYHGIRSSQYLDHDFGWGKGFGYQSNDPDGPDSPGRKNDDGYVGYYHYASGLDCTNESNIESYICKLVGIERVGINEFKKLPDEVLNNRLQQQMSNRSPTSGSHPSSPTTSSSSSSSFTVASVTSPTNLTSSRREMLITYCTYNIFNKSDFRARYVINLSNPIRIDKSFQIIYNVSRKTVSYNEDTITTNLPERYWEELRASQLVRLFSQLDDPSKQLSGLVSLPDLIVSKPQLLRSVTTLCRFLPKGHITDFRPQNGFSSGWGDKREGNSKTMQYKNYLVDSLIRLCQLDDGESCDLAISEIQKLEDEEVKVPDKKKGGDWDYIILQLLKIQAGTNNEQRFIHLVHNHITTFPSSTQSTLILLEQVKFLISKKNYQFALKIAEKCVESLPLDFDCWFTLALCYMLTSEYEKALIIINSLPVIIVHKQRNTDIEKISGIPDYYTNTFVNRLNENHEEVISEKTFLEYFPKPVAPLKQYPRLSNNNRGGAVSKSAASKFVDEGSISKIWNKFFLFDPTVRHSLTGNQFYQSPLMNATAKELSSVDPNLIKLCGPTSMKMMLSAQSGGSPTSSVLDFISSSTWGRCYDLLTLFIGLIGWDALVSLKESVFKQNQKVRHQSQEMLSTNKKLGDACVGDLLDQGKFQCEMWLDQLFIIVYEDLKSLMSITDPSKDQQHSALEWEVLGFLGWSVKYNLQESICALITSVKGKEMVGGFDYFGSVQLLKIYDEFILSDVNDSNVDIFTDAYEGKFYSNKLLVLNYGNDRSRNFIKDLESNLLNLDFIMLLLMKLISWNLRWYQYAPNHLVTKVLTKLVRKYDSVFIRGKLRVIFETNKRKVQTKSKSGSKYGFGFLVGGSKSKKKANGEEEYHFVDGDTIVDYTEMLLNWIESLNE